MNDDFTFTGSGHAHGPSEAEPPPGGTARDNGAHVEQPIDGAKVRELTTLKCQIAAETWALGGAPTPERLKEVSKDTGIPYEWVSAAAVVESALSGCAWPAPLDLKALSAVEPAPPAMIIDDWLPCGYATLFAGHGGVGKSGIALYLAVCAALGREFFGLEVRQCRVLYLSCEDRANILHWRLFRICMHLGITLDTLAGRLHVVDLVGREAVLWERDPKTGQTATPAYKQLTRMVRERGSELLIVDGISHSYGGNENVRPDVNRFVNSLVATVPETGAVLLVGHVNKPTASGVETSQPYSGSTGWHNAVRARWYLYPETERDEVEGDHRAPVELTGDLIMDLQKSNLGCIDQSMRFQWDDSAHLFLGREIVSETKADRDHRDWTERQGILAAFRQCREDGIYVPNAMQGQATAFHVLSVQPAFPKSLQPRAERHRFRRHIQELRRIRKIKEGSIQRKSRHWVATWELVDVGGSKAAPNASNTENEFDANATQGATASLRLIQTPPIGGELDARAPCYVCARCGGEGCEWCKKL